MLGAAYYAQWKLTPDGLGSYTLPAESTVNPDLHNNTHDVFGIAIDVTLPVSSAQAKLQLCAWIRCTAAGLALLTMVSGTAYAQKTDVVRLANGDRFTGEVTSLNRGQLTFSTDRTCC